MRRLTYLMTLAVLSFGLMGVVRAQSGAGSADADSEQQRTPMSPAEKIAAAQAIVGRGTALSERVTNLHTEALKEADMIKITCLSDKLAQINASLRAAERRVTTLSRAVDTVVQDHEFTVISVLARRFKTLEQEANACVGQDVYETGNASNSTKRNVSQTGTETNASNPPRQPVPVVVGSVPPVSGNT